MRTILAVRLGRIWVRNVAGATAALLVALAAVPVGAAPAVGPTGTGSRAGKTTPLAAGRRPVRITLITGDAVTYSTDRTYQVVVIDPTLAASPTGTVALKAEAHDAAGNSVQQTIMDAYVLK